MKIILITCAFIVADVLTGLLKALKNGVLDSTKLRQGAVHKLSELVAMAIAYLCQVCPQYVGVDARLPALAPVCAYLILMEIISCLENLCEVNPAMHKLLNPYLNKLNGGEPDNANN